MTNSNGKEHLEQAGTYVSKYNSDAYKKSAY
jgi:hypothetical protein